MKELLIPLHIKSEIPLLKAIKSDATYLMWVDISASGMTAKVFAKELRKKTGLYINDGTAYGKGGETFIRINLATSHAIVEDALLRLKAFLKCYPR